MLIANSVRPAPISPAMPTTSPRLTCRLTPLITCRSAWSGWSTRQFCDLEHVSPIVRLARRKAVGHLAADHALMMRSSLIVSRRQSSVSTVVPSRRMVIESATLATSLSLCEIRIEVMPCSLSSSSRSSSASLSLSLRHAVGSSRISSLTSLASALAISTSCCLPTPMLVISVLGASLRPDLGQQLPGPANVGVPVDDAALRRLVAEEDVLGDRQQRHQRELLVDDDDAEMFAVGDALETAAPRPRRRSRPRRCREG